MKLLSGSPCAWIERVCQSMHIRAPYVQLTFRSQIPEIYITSTIHFHMSKWVIFLRGKIIFIFQSVLRFATSWVINNLALARPIQPPALSIINSASPKGNGFCFLIFPHLVCSYFLLYVSSIQSLSQPSGLA